MDTNTLLIIAFIVIVIIFRFIVPVTYPTHRANQPRWCNRDTLFLDVADQRVTLNTGDAHFRKGFDRCFSVPVIGEPDDFLVGVIESVQLGFVG